jgi:hypothetical protein
MFDVAGSLCGISALWSFGADEIGCGEPPGALGRIAIGSLSPTAQSQRPANRSRRVVSTHPLARASVLIERRLSYHTVFIRKALKMCHLRSTKAIAKVTTVPESCSLTRATFIEDGTHQQRTWPGEAGFPVPSKLSAEPGQLHKMTHRDGPVSSNRPANHPVAWNGRACLTAKRGLSHCFRSLPQPSVH